MSLYPQIGQGSLNTAAGIANRIKDLERQVASVMSSSGYLGDGAVKESKVADDSISAGKIKNGAIYTSHIQAGAITSSLITAGAINAGHIQAGAITATQIATGTITATNIAAGTITATQIATGTITAVQISANTITAAKIAAGTITATEIAANTITAAKIAAGTITATEIAANTITAAKIAAGTITATEIAAGTITGALIAGGTITATNIATGTLTGSLLAAATITGDKLVVDTITSREVVGTTLSGIFADLGTVTAGTLRIGVAGGQKVAIGDSISTSAGTKSGIVATDTSNNITFWADPATGNLQIKGQLLTGSTGLGALAAGGGTIDGTSNIASATIAGDRLVANTITASKIAAATITSVEIAAATITGGKIAAGTITGTNIAAGTVSADKITVGGHSRSEIPNSGFDDLAADTTLPARWSRSAYYGGTPSTVFISTAAARSGIYGVKMVPGAGSQAGLQSDLIPANEGETFVQTAWVRQTGTNAGTSPGCFLGVFFYNASLTLISGGAVWATLNNATLPAAWTRVSGQVTAPATAAFAEVQMVNYSNNTGAAYEIDEARLDRGVGVTEILPGAITTAKLSATAIDGMTITGATIRTAASGARLELTTAGGLKKYDASGATPIVLGPSDGLDLLASDTGTPSNDRQIRWLEEGNTLARMWGYGGGASTTAAWALLEALNPVSGVTKAVVRAINSADNDTATLSADAGTAHELAASIGGSASHTRIILNSTAGSDFWQTITPTARRQISSGTITMSSGTTVNVNHGLTDAAGAGIEPGTVVVTCRTAGVYASATARTSTTFTITKTGGTAPLIFDWIATT